MPVTGGRDAHAPKIAVIFADNGKIRGLVYFLLFIRNCLDVELVLHGHDAVTVHCLLVPDATA